MNEYNFGNSDSRNRILFVPGIGIPDTDTMGMHPIAYGKDNIG